MALPDGVVDPGDGVRRCWWAAADALMGPYHDREWGRPVRDDNRLFEKLCLEGFQSGLSWPTILRKRENFRAAFKSFEIATVARFTPRTVERLLLDSGIVRNKAKIEATVNNARQCASLVDEFGSFAAYVWTFEPQSHPKLLDKDALVTTNAEATAMAKDLKRRGWAFVGPTTVYAFMQAMGLVNDHISGCAIGAEVDRARSKFRRPRPRR